MRGQNTVGVVEAIELEAPECSEAGLHGETRRGQRLPIRDICPTAWIHSAPSIRVRETCEAAGLIGGQKRGHGKYHGGKTKQQVARQIGKQRSDKTEAPRDATFSACAPRGCRVLRRQSSAKNRDWTEDANTTWWARRRYDAKQGTTESKMRETQDIPNNPPVGHVRPPNFLGFLVLGR